ncbi:helix-turn-helix domain-containing protein [Brevibacillus marinus]|uniref:helix-turn-helix domain-containing protein n=1 Tax=Brevibacillus marinus TaxID=2496837 RepID=UPI001F495F00|nr:helix-turn-helix domain-containing protein [Brevibacillus marinus]
MRHNFLIDKQISEIEERLKSMQKLMMIDVDTLIKEVRAYRELLKEHEYEKEKAELRKGLGLPEVDEDVLKDYPDILTPKDIQKILGVSKNQAYELMHSGQFQVIKIGQRYRILKSVFVEWLKGK